FVSIESLQAAAPGDLDASGDKTVLDAVLLQKHLVRQGHLNAFQTPLADLNGDNTINIIDLALLKQALTQAS
ncbi:MAG: dockerin type I repeat-containing protein, partial [Oscillospiraceae bacterium]|nr:dockerin type I repeat-containing protein [Oscillospiraceae bacterium]